MRSFCYSVVRVSYQTRFPVYFILPDPQPSGRIHWNSRRHYLTLRVRGITNGLDTNVWFRLWSQSPPRETHRIISFKKNLYPEGFTATLSESKFFNLWMVLTSPAQQGMSMSYPLRNYATCDTNGSAFFFFTEKQRFWGVFLYILTPLPHTAHCSAGNQQME